MLTLQQASIIVDRALDKGRELGVKPLTVVVLDAGGQLKALKRRAHYLRERSPGTQCAPGHHHTLMASRNGLGSRARHERRQIMLPFDQVPRFGDNLREATAFNPHN
jgi:hypothetical protein